jgi:hypothetical protein
MTDTYGTQPHRDPKPDPKLDPKHAAEEQRKIEEQRRADMEKKSDEHRKAAHEAETKRREDEHKFAEERIAAARKYEEAKRKEDARRAALSPAERAAEDDKFSSLTPEERAKEVEGKGLVKPDQYDQINLLAGQPSFAILTEPHHAAEFVLSEANGHLSRANAYLADPVTVTVGMPLKQTVAPTATTPGTYVPAAAGADCQALALYAGGSIPGQGLRIAVLVRSAEVNGNLITWGSITAPEQAIGLTTLAAAGIIARY